MKERWATMCGRRRRAGLVGVLVALALVLSSVSVAAQPSDDDEETPQQADEDVDEESLFELPDEQDEQDGADDGDDEAVRRQTRKPLGQMTREEARQAGFIFGDEDEGDSRSSAIFLAATAGLFAHGVGHWYLDDRRTAAALLVMQGASMGLMGSALLWDAVSDGSPAARSYGTSALYAGAGLFGLSYLLDVIGTAYNTDIGFPSNSRRTRGVSAAANYTYYDLEGFETNSLQMLSADASFDLGWGYASARTEQDVNLDTSLYGATLGTRFGHGPNAHSYFFAEVDAGYLTHAGTAPVERWGGEAIAGLSVGLGDWISQLRQVAVGASTGVAARWYALPSEGGAELEPTFRTSHVPFELFMHFNLTEHLNARAAYANRDGSLLQSTPRGVGVGSLELLYHSAPNIDLVVGAQAGGGLAVSGGLRVWLWQ